MRGIAGNEDPPLLKAIRQTRPCLPGQDAKDFDGNRRVTDGGAYNRAATLGQEIFRALSSAGVIDEMEDPTVVVADTDEHATRLRGADLAQCEWMVADQRTEIRLEEHID